MYIIKRKYINEILESTKFNIGIYMIYKKVKYILGVYWM